MTFNPDIHHRRSIRLHDFDYASSAAYFVTICAQGREFLFGTVVDGEMIENDAGRMVGRWWNELANKFSAVEPDTFVLMPDHCHGIIFLVGADLCVRPDLLENKSGAHTGAPLPTIIQWFKTMSTNEYINNVATSRWPPFPGRLWQRNYFERVIRNDVELDKFRDYILTNPARWVVDVENPHNH
jgi:REP element-mobilizing transposase RayT